MGDKSNLEDFDVLENIHSSAVLISESVSVMVEAFARMWEGDKFIDLTEKIETAIEKAKRKAPPYPPKEKNNNNIIKNTKPKKEKTKTKVLISSTQNSDEPEITLKDTQQKTKTTIPRELVEIYERDEIPNKFAAYAIRKKMLADPVPVFGDFVLYHVKKNSKMANWYAAWQTWVRNQITFKPECMQPQNVALKQNNLGDIFEN